jgi:hypothetical protein
MGGWSPPDPDTAGRGIGPGVLVGLTLFGVTGSVMILNPPVIE